MSTRAPTGHAGRRLVTCQQCGANACWAQAPWGAVLLDPFPDPEGKLHVDVLRAGLLVLGPKDKRSSLTKRWDRHACPKRGVGRPKPEPEQLDLF